MRKSTMTVVLVAVVTALAEPSAAQPKPKPETKPPCTVSAAFEPTVREVVVDWHAVGQCLARKGVFDGRISGVRLDESMSVTVRSKNFNFVNYALKYTIEDTVIESYVLLTTLWQQILGLSELNVLAADIRTRAVPPPFQTALLRWINAIVAAERSVEAPRTRFTGTVHLSDAELTTVSQYVEAVTRARDDLSAAYNALPQFDDFVDYERYGKVRPVHEAVLARVSAYLDLATLTLRGQPKTIGKKKGGTFTTVTMTPAVRDGADGSPVLSVEYFSHSRLPVTFHAGYVGSALDDFEFQQIRALSGRDLFAVVKTNENTQALAALVSYEVRSWRNNSIGLLASIGTDFAKPGERLYIGGSLRVFGRVFITAGGASGETREGISPVLEQIGELTNARELFGAINTRRSWSGFLGLSFGVF